MEMFFITYKNALLQYVPLTCHGTTLVHYMLASRYKSSWERQERGEIEESSERPKNAKNAKNTENA